MEPTPSNIRAVSRTFSAAFQSAYEAAETTWPLFATEVPSSSSENVYAWMARVPEMREWIGERKFLNAAAFEYTLKNKEYELSIEIPRSSVEDDTFGVFKPLAEEIGMAARRLPEQLITNLLINGQNLLCYDGQGFFDTDHPQDPNNTASTTWSNYYASGYALSSDNFEAMRAKMLKFLDNDGKPLGVRPNILAVPPALEVTARKIVEATNNASGATNVLKGLAQVVVLDRLTSDTEWYLFDARRPIKPFIWQNRRAPRLVMKTSPEDESVLYRKSYDHMVDGRGNAGFSLPWLALKAAA